MPRKRTYVGQDQHGQHYWLDPDGPYGGYCYRNEFGGFVDWLCVRQSLVVREGVVTLLALGFSMNGKAYRADRETVDVLRVEVDAKRVEGVAAIMSLGLKAGRIVELVT